MIWLFWCLIAFFFLSRKQQRSNQSNQKHVHCVCHRKKVVQLKDVHGVAFTVIWIIAAIRQNCRTLLVSIMMLIAGALGLCKGAHKNYGYYIFALLHIKRILKKKRATWQPCFCLYVHFISVLLRVSKTMICQSFALRAILNGHPCSTYSADPGGIPDLGRASHVFCLRQTHELILHSQREREICLSRGGGWAECRDEWMDGVACGSRYSHIRRLC